MYAQNPNHTKNKNDKSNVSKVYQFFVFLLYLLPGRDTVAGVHEGLPLGALGHVVDEDSRHVDRDEQDDVGHQLQSTQTTTINNQLQSTQTITINTNRINVWSDPINRYKHVLYSKIRFFENHLYMTKNSSVINF